ncbi:MAG: hypothetical protein R3B06_07515 [Kofleriaceae bacterium]
MPRANRSSTLPALLLLLGTTLACGGSSKPPADPTVDTLARPPGTEVDAAACGPAMGMPARQCADGSLGGNTGRCVVLADGQVGWEVRACPVATGADDE